MLDRTLQHNAARNTEFPQVSVAELYGGVWAVRRRPDSRGILFHSLPYYKRAKDTLCTDKYKQTGTAGVDGCVRLTVEDAKWIAEKLREGTTVENIRQG